MDAIRVNPADGGTIIEFVPITQEPTGPEQGGKAFLYFLKNQGYRLKKFGQASEPLTEAEAGTVFDAQAGDPAPITGKGQIYAKIAGGKVQLFFIADDGTVYQITPGGEPLALHQGGDARGVDMTLGTLDNKNVEILLNGVLRAVHEKTKGKLRLGDGVTPAYSIDVGMQSDGAQQLNALRLMVMDNPGAGNTVNAILASKDSNGNALTLFEIQAVCQDPTAASPKSEWVLYGQNGSTVAVILWNGSLNQLFIGAPINMQTLKITAMGDPTSAQDAATKHYVDLGVAAAEAYSDAKEVLDVRLDGSRAMTGILDLGTHKIQNVVDPTAAQEAATKAYVDTALGTASDPLDKKFFIDNGLMPSTTIKEILSVMTAFDFQTVGRTPPDIKFGRALTAVSQDSYLGFNLGGAGYKKVLLIVGLLRGFDINGGLFACKTLDGSNTPSDGWMHMNEANAIRFRLYPLPSFSPFLAQDLATGANAAGVSMVNYGMAMYIDLTAHRIIGFVRNGIERWCCQYDLTDPTNITLDVAKFVGAFVHNGAAYVGCPIGIYGTP